MLIVLNSGNFMLKTGILSVFVSIPNEPFRNKMNKIKRKFNSIFRCADRKIVS